MSQLDAAVPVIAPATAEPEKHIVQTETLAAIKVGASRATVLATLGEPSARYSMAASDEVREIFRYHRPDGQPVEIRMLNGRVASVP